jgi:hypothetical protein
MLQIPACALDKKCYTVGLFSQGHDTALGFNSKSFLKPGGVGIRQANQLKLRFRFHYIRQHSHATEIAFAGVFPHLTT